MVLACEFVESSGPVSLGADTVGVGCAAVASEFVVVVDKADVVDDDDWVEDDTWRPASAVIVALPRSYRFPPLLQQESSEQQYSWELEPQRMTHSPPVGDSICC
jgi:hypothetical protein